MESTETANHNIHRSRGMYLLGFLTKYDIQSLLLISVAILAAVNPYFRSIGNFQNILLQASFAGIGAAGMTLLIVSGAFDLSVAGLLGLCGVLISALLPWVGAFLTFLAALLLGVLLGSLNGVVVTKLRIPAFIATLGMMNIYLAFASSGLGAVALLRFPIQASTHSEPALYLAFYRYRSLP